MMKSISLDDLFQMLKNLFPKMLKGVNSLSEAMPKLMEAMPNFMGRMMPVMMNMMGKDNVEGGMMMPNMMMKMMPHCLGVMLPYMPKEKRTNLLLIWSIHWLVKRGAPECQKRKKKNLELK